MRIGIIGAPGSGKTTLCAGVRALAPRLSVVHTDDYINEYSFSECAPALVARFGNQPDTIIEGVQCARMLKYGYTPDLVAYLSKPSVNPRHRSLSTLQVKAWQQWEGLALQDPAPADILEAIDQYGTRKNGA